MCYIYKDFCNRYEIKLENKGKTLTSYNPIQFHVFYYEYFHIDLQQNDFLTLMYYMDMLMLLFYEVLYITNKVS